MKTRILTSALAIAAVLASVATAAPQPGNELEDFAVKGKVVKFNENASKVSLRQKLYAGGKLVGRDRIVCTFEARKVLCSARAKFRDGTIKAKGEAGQKMGALILPIVDGTGQYMDATGSLLLESAGNENTRETFDFDPVE